MKKLAFVQLTAALVLTGACTMQGGGRDSLGRGKSPVQPQPPTTVTCSNLDESACLAATTCVANYSEVCPMVMCQPGDAGCPPCTKTFISCSDPAPLDPCQGLSEAQCTANPSCEAVYTAGTCACPANGAPCPPCTSGFDHCEAKPQPTDPCAGLPEDACALKEPFCQPIYEAGPYTLQPCTPEDGGCDVPKAYLGCGSGVRNCQTNCDCNVNEYCQMQEVYPKDPPEVFSEDGGIAMGGCLSAPTYIGVCTPAPNSYPVPTPIGAMDAGVAGGGGSKGP